MLTLVPRAQHYSWGSPDVIPNFLGETATGTPVAEAWQQLTRVGELV